MLTNDVKIAMYEARKNKLLARGPHNWNIAKKLQRKIYRLQSEAA